MSCVKSQPYLELLESIMSYKALRPVFTLFKAYFDDSGNDEIFSLSCVFAKVSNWGFFINDWLDVLDRKNQELKAQGSEDLVSIPRSRLQQLRGRI